MSSSGATVLDKVEFQLGINTAALDAKYAAIEAKTDVLATKIKAKTATFFSDTPAGSAKLIQMRQAVEGLAAAHDTKLTPALTAAMRGIDAVSGATIGSITAFQRGRRDVDEYGAAHERLHKPLTTTLRHVASIGNELREGNLPRAGYSLAALSSHFFGLSLSTLAWYSALISIPVAIGAAAYSAGSLFSRTNVALAATNYASGVTLDRLRTVAQTGAAGNGFSIRSNFDAGAALVSRGNVGSALLPSATRAALGYGIASGQDSGEAAKKFEEFLAKPAEGAKALNDQFKLLTVSQQRHIEELGRSGEYERAQAELIKAANDRFGPLKDSVWSLALAFDGLKVHLSNFWFNTGASASGNGRSQERASLEAEFQRYLNMPLTGPKALSDPAQRYRERQMMAISSREAYLDQQERGARQSEKTGQTERAIGDAMSDYDSGVGTFANRKQRLQEQLNRGQYAVRLGTGNAAAGQPDNPLLGQVTAERDAAQALLNNLIDPGSEAVAQAREDRRIALASPRTRGVVEGQVSAARARRSALQDPATAPFAGAIYSAQMSTVGVGVNADRNQHLADVKEEANQAKLLLTATRDGVDATMRQNAANQAHSAFLKGEINDEKGYTTALIARANAQRDANAITEDRQLSQTLALRQQEYRLLTATNGERIKATAQITTMQQLVNEGFTGKALQDEYEKRVAINEQIAIQTDQTQKLSQESQDGASAIVNNLNALTQPGFSLLGLFKSIDLSIAQWIEKTLILIPLQETLARAIAGAGGAGGILNSLGQALGMSLGIGGGGFSPQAATIGANAGFPVSAIPSKLARGGAFSGGVRFAAKGTVLGGPTMFSDRDGGRVIGGEAGAEGLLPLFRAPDGSLGVRTQAGGGHTTMVNQYISVHPDVSAVARGEIYKALPMIRSASAEAVAQGRARGNKALG